LYIVLKNNSYERIEVSIKRELPIDWIKKYFNILLIDKLSLLYISGMKAIMFISRETQSWNHLLVDRAISLVCIKIKTNNIDVITIYKGFYHNWGMNPIASFSLLYK